MKDPGAIVSVSTPRESGLTILPATGSSPLTTDISLTGETKNSPVTLIVSASAGGTTRTADVTVTIEASLQKGFE